MYFIGTPSPNLTHQVTQLLVSSSPERSQFSESNISIQKKKKIKNAMPPPTYIISRVADPIFAVVMGISAAAMRINREEKEKGRTTQQTVDAALR